MSTAESPSHPDGPSAAIELSLAHQGLLGPEHGPLRTTLTQELLVNAAWTGNRSDRLIGLLWRCVDLFLEGEPHAERALAELTEELRAYPHPDVASVARSIAVMLTIRSGQLGPGEVMAARFLSRGLISGDVDVRGRYRSQLLAIRWFQGRAGELLPELTRQRDPAVPGAGDDDAQLATLALAAASAGDHRTAAAALAGIGGGDVAAVASSGAWLVTQYLAVEAAAQLALPVLPGQGVEPDLDGTALAAPALALAATSYRLLAPFARLPILASLAVSCFGSVEHALGVAALTMGDLDLAVEHLRTAVRRNLALGHWPAACLSRHRLGQALVRRGGCDDAGEARRTLGQAHREAEQLGMVLPRSPQPASGPAPASCSKPTLAIAVPEPVTARQVRLLGPVEVSGDPGAPPLSGARRKMVLAVLALNSGRVVSADRLISLVWGDEAPRTAANTLQSHISYLRRLLGGKDTIRSRAPGYVLDLGDDGTDEAVASRLITAGTRADDPAERITRLEAALALWRGQPLMDVPESVWVQTQADRLSQLQFSCRLALAQARLALGRPEQALPDLELLGRENPLQEEVQAQLMLALYRSTRQSEALGVYQRLRTALGDLGIEPTPALRELQVAVLRQDAALLAPAAPAQPAPVRLQLVRKLGA
jgi:DNA-binding SARP family transcriptional activator